MNITNTIHTIHFLKNIFNFSTISTGIHKRCSTHRAGNPMRKFQSGKPLLTRKISQRRQTHCCPCNNTAALLPAQPKLRRGKMQHNAIDKSFNMCTVDGDTSTNDTMILLANGASGVEVKTEEDKAALAGLIEHICIDMARRIASDGEGATHLIVVESYGLPTEHDARLVAKAIAGSTLFKAAVFGHDANWGRIMAAAGYSGADVDPTKADCIIKSSAGEVQVMKDGFGTDFSEELAKAVLTEHDITVIVDFHSGDGKAVAYGCDLTYEYVKINGDYRT